MILEALTRRTVRGRRTLKPLAGGEGNGVAGEERLLLSGVSWERYLEIDEAFGLDRPDPRLYYLDGEVEVMTTSLQHERLKKWLGGLIEDYLLAHDRETFPHGQATIRILQEAGAEPDESWCLDTEKEYPDLVLEIALTSGGIDKLEIYRRFSVSEVWLWRKGGLEIWTLRKNGSRYDGPAKKSRLLPELDTALLVRCVSLDSWREARSLFREGLKKRK